VKAIWASEETLQDRKIRLSEGKDHRIKILSRLGRERATTTKEGEKRIIPKELISGGDRMGREQR